MPNWIEGTFRARGTKDNIIRFVKEGLKPSSLLGVDDELEMKLIDYEHDEDYFEAKWIRKREDKKDYPECLYLDGTERFFLKLDGYGEIPIHRAEEKTDFIMVVPFKAAWSIKLEQIREISMKYGVDIRINGYECGMEFEQIIEITRKGQKLTDAIISYPDYQWECPMPLLGG